MTPERFRQIRNLFEAVVERPPEARGTFLAEACEGDADLQAEVERLLAAHRRDTDLLAGPAILPANPQRLEGRHVGPYEILREIGRGGMGTVYLAVRADGAFRKQVALKIVRPEAGSEEVLRRFQQEREMLATLDHPNIARLLDGGSTDDGLPYFVMEYVNGEPIDTYCDRHKLKVVDRLELFRTVCAAVEYAHRNGIAHRDLKPGNILVTGEGTAKLLDFGIAKLLRAAEDETVYITRTGLHLMTPEYASPEQVRGEAITALSDVYSLGVILYELLTGHRPYRMRSRLFHEIVRVICEEPPTRPSTAAGLTEERPGMRDAEPITVTPEMVSRARDASPAELRRQLTGDLDNVLLKSLSKEPLERYRSAEQMSEDIRHHLQGEPVLATGATLLYRIGKFLRRNRIWVIWLAGVGASLVLFVLLAVLANVARRLPVATQSVQLTNRGNLPGVAQSNPITLAPRLFPSDSRIYYQYGRILWMPVTGGESSALPYGWEFRLIGLAQDDAILLVRPQVSSGAGGLFLARSPGSTPLPIALAVGGSPPDDGTFSPDGRSIAYTAGDGLYVVSREGKNSRRLAMLPNQVSWPRWSPDGAQLRFDVLDRARYTTEIWEVRTDGSGLHPLLPGWNPERSDCCGTWTPDGKYFVFQSTRSAKTEIWIKREDSLRFINAMPVKLSLAGMDVLGPAPSRDGKRLYVTGKKDRGGLVKISEPSQSSSSFLGALSAEGLDFTADGQWVTHTLFPDGSLWRSRPDETERLRLSPLGMRVILPRFSPDGKQIAFQGLVPGGTWTIYLVPSAGGPLQEVLREDCRQTDVSWSPDGHSLMFQRRPLTRVWGEAASPGDQLSGVYILDLKTHKLSRLPGSANLWQPRWSPNGRYVAAISFERRQLMLWDFKDPQWSDWVQFDALLVTWPTWSNSGDSLYYRNGAQRVLRVRVGEHQSREFANLGSMSGAALWFGIAPDGSLLVLQNTGSSEIYAIDVNFP